MGGLFPARQKELARQLKKIISHDLDSLSREVFAAIHKVISFRVGWFFPIDRNRSPIGASPLWSEATSFVEGAPYWTLLPSVDALLQKGRFCIRGEEWWDVSRLSDHPIFQKILKPANLQFALITLLLDDKKNIRGYLVLWREKEKSAFGDSDIALMLSVASDIGSKIDGQGNRKPQKPSISEINEEDLGALIRRRAQPGVLILNKDGQVVYLNPDGQRLLKALTVKVSRDSGGYQTIPHIVEELFSKFREMIRPPFEDEVEASLPTLNRACIHEGSLYLFRALPLQRQGQRNEDSGQILVLIEKVLQEVGVDQIMQSKKLSEREQAVTRLLLEGKTNKEVATSLDIGEYTVKGHVKQIMKKLRVETRAGIVANILQKSRLS